MKQGNREELQEKAHSKNVTLATALLETVASNKVSSYASKSAIPPAHVHACRRRIQHYW